MSAPVDVLAVMRDAAAWMPNVVEAQRVREASAAVAELIEAGKGATEEKMHDGASSKAACDRLVAALARVGGAK